MPSAPLEDKPLAMQASSRNLGFGPPEMLGEGLAASVARLGPLWNLIFPVAFGDQDTQFRTVPGADTSSLPMTTLWGYSG
jgi:hypothetical protein